jgi:hypothetical protein
MTQTFSGSSNDIGWTGVRVLGWSGLCESEKKVERGDDMICHHISSRMLDCCMNAIEWTRCEAISSSLEIATFGTWLKESGR